MKSKSDVIYKLPLLVSLCALLVAVPLRVYQYFKVLEPETGFYSTIDFSVYIIYALLGIAVITAIAIPLINRKKMITVASVKKSPVFLVLSLILAVTIITSSSPGCFGCNCRRLLLCLRPFGQSRKFRRLQAQASRSDSCSLVHFQTSLQVQENYKLYQCLGSSA